MFAVVEFDTKECDVAPLLWVHEDNKKCYWPRKNSDHHTKTKTVPKLSWPSHNLRKIHGTYELLEDATVMLQNIIEASESESGAGVPPLTRKNNFYELENESETRNRSEMRDRSKSPDRSDTPLGALPSSYSSTRGRSISRVRSESRDRSQTRDRSQNRDTSETHDRSDTPLGALSSPSYSATLTSASSLSTSVALNEGVTERILQTMLSISEQVAQNTLRNQQILRILNSNECAVLKKPDNFPILPCNKKTIKQLEKCLREEDGALNYFKQRLSTLGGTTVRQMVANMMKYIMTNKLGKKFNWAGHNGKKTI